MFAILRERAGVGRVELEFPGDSTDLTTFREEMGRRVPAIEALLPLVRVAVNEDFAGPEHLFRADDDVALIPPVSGGSGQGPFRIRRESIFGAEVEASVRGPGAGAVVTFLGTVRDRTAGNEVLALEYEAYDSMAERFFRRIAGEISERWPEARTAIEHRVGRLAVGEVSVAIAVSHPHRAAAFDACRHAIERLKADVPIWKKEIRGDGSIWVGVGS